eukprot:TRINITY_DN89773_c0_g1_i1.p1 TRINITY_DN89773_c0_g1~~TRINITY_DN89773_c0_g1_i1.p1  ORF type:complete len:386 (+),score=70.38 TRINITY_DN89773_c0_g1_i1:99-1256(+)
MLASYAVRVGSLERLANSLVRKAETLLDEILGGSNAQSSLLQLQSVKERILAVEAEHAALLASCPAVASTPDELSDPNVVFECCDTDSSGALDESELKFALRAFGFYLDTKALRKHMDGRETFDKLSFISLLSHLEEAVPQNERRHRAIPYARRGMSLAQLTTLQDTFIRSGWLQQACDDFNEKSKQEIDSGKVFELHANLYALDRFVVQPATNPKRDDKQLLPSDLLTACQLPLATHECSYSELVNPAGVIVCFFVSHFWGHPFASTMQALTMWSHQSQESNSTMRGVDIVFWVCLFALNQHCPGEEVGSSPEEGPFNAALSKASAGAIMILDETVRPFQRIWCLYEVLRISSSKKQFHLLCHLGPVNKLLDIQVDDPLKLQVG